MKKLFNSNHKSNLQWTSYSYTNYDSYKFKQNEALMDEPIYLVFAVKELSKMLMYKTRYDTFQPYFGQHNLQL